MCHAKKLFILLALVLRWPVQCAAKQVKCRPLMQCSALQFSAVQCSIVQCSAVGRWPYWPHCTNPCLPRCSFFPCSLPARVSALHRAVHCTAPCSVQCSQVQCGAVAGSASTAAAIPTVGHRAVSGLCTALSLPQTPQGKDLHSSKAFLYGEKNQIFVLLFSPT